MLAQIGDYLFEINQTNFDKLKRSINFNFTSTQRLGNFSSWQSVGKYEETINIDGTLIAKSQEQLKAFELMARDKKPLTMAFTNGTCLTVLILNLELDQSAFLKDGAFLRQTYKISLGVVGDGFRI